mgnify:CR=1 FL=1
MCDCVGDWSGAFCSVSPCATIGCNGATSSACIVNNIAQRARCVCCKDSNGVALFTGANCATPVASCDDTVCEHGGFRSGHVTADGSEVTCNADCTCLASGAWLDPTCSTCERDCHNKGAANINCNKCVCGAGFTEESDCLCRSVTLGLVGHMWQTTTTWITARNTTITDALRTKFAAWIVTEGTAFTVMARGSKISASRLVSLNITARQFKFEIDVTSAITCSSRWVTAVALATQAPAVTAAFFTRTLE